jgi:hypothetical protein
MEVVTRAAQTALDRRMSRAIVAVRTSRLPWCRSNLVPRAAPSLLARRGGVACSPALGVLSPLVCLDAPGMPPLARTGLRRCSPFGSGSCRHRATDMGTAIANPDQGTAATARPGRGALATAATDRGANATRALGQPSLSHTHVWASSLMNRGGAWKT